MPYPATSQYESREEVLKDIATKFWQVKIEKFRKGLRQIKGSGMKRLVVFTPVGSVTVIFMPFRHRFGILIKFASEQSYITLEMPVEQLFMPENQEKEIMDIAFMTCDWNFGHCVPCHRSRMGK